MQRVNQQSEIVEQKNQTNRERELKPLIKRAQAANIAVRKVIPIEHSNTHPSIKDKPTLFRLWKEINLAREQNPTLEEAFNCFLLTSRNPLEISIRLCANVAQQYPVGNCQELSKLSIKYLRRSLKDGDCVELNSIKKSDHVITVLNKEVILDTLLEKAYPYSDRFENLKCYRFDWTGYNAETINDPHLFTSFTVQHELKTKGFIKCFTDEEYNKITVRQFYIKLNVIEKSFSKYSNSKNTHALAEMLKAYKIEVNEYDLSALTNLELERKLDRKIKKLKKIKYFLNNEDQKDEFILDVLMNIQPAYFSSYHYFLHLIYLEPLFSRLLNDIKTNEKIEPSILNTLLEDKEMLDKLFYETFVTKLADKPTIKNILIEYGADPLTVLAWAIKDNKKSIIERVIHFKDKDGNLPYHLAAKANDADIIQLILDKKADWINEKDKNSWTALHFACEHGNIYLVEQLLKRGANPMLATSKDECTALHIAAKKGHTTICQLILKATATKAMWFRPINRPDVNKSTALHYACQHGNFDLVRELLRHKANLNVMNRDGFLPLHVAIKEGHVQIVKCILGENDDLLHAKDGKGRTPLVIASEYGQGSLEMLEVLTIIKKNQLEELSSDHPNLEAKRIGFSNN